MIHRSLFRVFALALAAPFFLGLALAKPAEKPPPPPLLPSDFAGWHLSTPATSSVAPQAADNANADLLREDGFAQFAAATYTRNGDRLSVRAMRFEDASGALTHCSSSSVKARPGRPGVFVKESDMQRSFISIAALAAAVALSPPCLAASDVSPQARAIARVSVDLDGDDADATVGRSQGLMPSDPSFTELRAKSVDADHEDLAAQAAPAPSPPSPQGSGAARHNHHVRNVVIIVALGAVLLIVLAAAAR